MAWRCRSNGYRQLCSLWFEYDLCLNRKPPNDLESCLTTLIRIRSTSVPKGGWAMVQIWSRNSPMSSAVCQSSGYRQLCSLWFEYDLCLNRKLPSEYKSCLMTLIRIRSTSDPKGLSYDSNMIRKPPSGFGSMPIKRASTAMFSLVRIRPMFEQEAPKWSWLDSYMIISRTKRKAWFRYDPLPVGCFTTW